MSRPLDAAAVDGLRGARVHVVGLAGTEGTAITRFLAARGVTDLHAHDIAEGEALEKSFMQVHVGLPISERERMWQEMMELGIDLRTGADYLRGIEDADVVFASQGWYLYPANHPRLDHVRDAGTRAGMRAGTRGGTRAGMRAGTRAGMRAGTRAGTRARRRTRFPAAAHRNAGGEPVPTAPP